MMPFHSLTAAALVAVLLASAAAADADAQDQRTGWDGKGIAQNRGTNANTTVNRDDLRTFHEDSPLSMEDANFSLGDTMKSGSEIVTVELFPRAESDKVFSGYLSLGSSFRLCSPYSSLFFLPLCLFTEAPTPQHSLTTLKRLIRRSTPFITTGRSILSTTKRCRA